MRIVFTSHARRRMRERRITVRDIREAVRRPDRIARSGAHPNRWIVKRRHVSRMTHRPHLLLIICERARARTRVVTVIDTSNLTKYL